MWDFNLVDILTWIALVVTLWFIRKYTLATDRLVKQATTDYQVRTAPVVTVTMDALEKPSNIVSNAILSLPSEMGVRLKLMNLSDQHARVNANVKAVLWETTVSPAHPFLQGRRDEFIQAHTDREFTFSLTDMFKSMSAQDYERLERRFDEEFDKAAVMRLQMIDIDMTRRFEQKSYERFVQCLLVGIPKGIRFDVDISYRRWEKSYPTTECRLPKLQFRLSGYLDNSGEFRVRSVFDSAVNVD